MSNLDNNQIVEIEHNEEIFAQQIAALKTQIAQKTTAAIVCQSKKNNPNFFAIISANQAFCQAFNTDEEKILGRNYDYLFDENDLNYNNDENIEYIHLIKSVKSFEACKVEILIENQTENQVKNTEEKSVQEVDLNDENEENKAQNNPNKTAFNISFTPIDIPNLEYHYAIFTFEKSLKTATQNQNSSDQNFAEQSLSSAKAMSSSLLKNMERSLRKEILLREVASLIISDSPISEIAQQISITLCEYLKADRCIIHDFQDSQTSFVAEYANSYSRKFFSDKTDQEGLIKVGKYINFHNRFFNKFGHKDKKSFLAIIEDASINPNFDSIRNICDEFSVVSIIAATTTFNNQNNGGIYIHQSEKRSWLTDEIELVQMIADQLSIAIDRSQSIEKVMITNHALMERTVELREALRQEQEMRKMQNEFVALVSHEFKTPLQIIDGTRELVVRKIRNLGLKDETLDKAFDRIKSGIQRMNGLIHSTLNLARMENGEGKIRLEMQNFDLKAFVLDIIEKNSNLAVNKQIQLLVKIDELPTSFNGDPKLLDHSITNIISNAIKYSKNETTVKIFAKANDKKVALRVIDQGIGIPKEDLANIGKKFFRAKNTLAVAGTGIGIYLTKYFVELHSGNVQIESEQDVGTTVTVTLPVLNIPTLNAANS